MKFSIIFIGFTFFGFHSLQAQMTLAHVESDSVIPFMPSYQEAMNTLQSYAQILQKQLEGKEAEAQAYYMEYAEKKKKGLLAPKEEQDYQTKLQQMEEKLKTSAQEMEKKLEDKEVELMKPIEDAYNKAILEVCKENKYAYIIDKKMVLYAEGGINATPKVKAKLNL
jgi:outer membrane protein